MVECRSKELGPEPNVQLGRSNVDLGRVEDAWTKCLPYIRQVCEKNQAHWKCVFWAVMDLEKAYDSHEWHGMWQMLRVYGVG